MLGNESPPPAAFDDFAEGYDEALGRGLSLTGESRDYFAQRRVEWLARRLRQIGMPARPIVMDYGCGTGTTIPILIRVFDPASLFGLDVSEHELAIARKTYPLDRTIFRTVSAHTPDASVDIIYCNGTFHHIPPAERIDVVRMLYASLKPGGFFAIWENNPWNPGTRLVMSRIPFDKDAITLSIPETRNLICQAGFEISCIDSLFYFPKPLAFLRVFEPLLSKLPLGGQYMVLAKKPR